MPKDGLAVGADELLTDLCGQRHGKERQSAVPAAGSNQPGLMAPEGIAEPTTVNPNIHNTTET